MKYILKLYWLFSYRSLFSFLNIILDCFSQFNYIFNCPFLLSPHCYFTSQKHHILSPILLQNTNVMALFPFNSKSDLCSVGFFFFTTKDCVTHMCFNCEHLMLREGTNKASGINRAHRSLPCLWLSIAGNGTPLGLFIMSSNSFTWNPSIERMRGSGVTWKLQHFMCSQMLLAAMLEASCPEVAEGIADQVSRSYFQYWELGNSSLYHCFYNACIKIS